MARWDQNPALWQLNSTRRVWRRRNAAYDPKNTIPTSNMEGETLCFGGVFLLTGQDNCTASKGRWTMPCTVRVRALKPGHWKWVVGGYSSMKPNNPKHTAKVTVTRRGSKRSTLRSWSGLASLQTLIPCKIGGGSWRFELSNITELTWIINWTGLRTLKPYTRRARAASIFWGGWSPLTSHRKSFLPVY